VRDAAVLAAGYALQGLTSVYLLVFTTWAMIAASLSWMITAPRGTRARAAALLVLAGTLAVALLAVYLLAYAGLHVDRQFARVARDNQAFGSLTEIARDGDIAVYRFR
jgi:hypothetical protein